MSRSLKLELGLLVVVLIVSFGTIPFRTQPEKTIEILSAQGYTDIKPGGYGWFQCGNGDIFQTKFTATTPADKTISGCVCSGLFKGHTIRLD